MSWDVLFQDLPAGIRTIDEIRDDFVPGPLCARHELFERIRRAVPDVDFTDPTWGVLERDGFSIELNLGNGDPVDSMMLHVRGGDGALDVVREIAAALGRTAIDCSSGELLDFGAADPGEGLRRWRAYRDHVVKGG